MSGGVADGEEFGTGGRIAEAFAFVVAAGDHLAVEQDHGTDGNVAVVDRCRGLGKSQPHEFVVGHDSETSEAADPVGMAAPDRRSVLEWPFPLPASRAIYAPGHGEHA